MKADTNDEGQGARIPTREGDIIAVAEALRPCTIMHQANCFACMGAGLARALADRWPIVATVDRAFSFGNLGEPRLGLYSVAEVSPGIEVLNAYTQLDYGRGRKHTSYDALYDLCERVRARLMANPDTTLLLPWGYGCGLGGGDWRVVSSIFEATLPVQQTLICKLPT